MKHRSTLLASIAAIVLLSGIRPQSLHAACPDPSPLDLSNVHPATSLADANAQFKERTKAALKRHALYFLSPAPDDCGWTASLLARLAYKDYFNTDVLNNVNLRQEAFASLAALDRDPDDWKMGTSFPDGFLESLANIFATATRKGEYDVNMNALATVLYKYGKRGRLSDGTSNNILPPAVYAHVLSQMDLTTPDVEELTLKLNPITVCPLLCGLNPLCLAGCAAIVEALDATLPETENHLNNIYVSRYLANQLQLDETGNPAFDNARNGYRPLMLNRLAGFIRNDFIEYNAHPYQNYTMEALLNLYSYADDPKVKQAAQMALDYVSAKVAVSSNDARRSTPFRRLDEPEHNDAALIDLRADPQTAFYMMLAGVTDMAGTDPSICQTGVNSGKPCDQATAAADCGAGVTCRTGNNTAEAGAPGGFYAEQFQDAGLSDYTIPPLIHDLFVTRDHRKFYQFFHYCNTGCNDELYFGSPSFLIAAGGHTTEFAYTIDVPSPVDVIVDHIGRDVDKGAAVATVLMPTRDLTSRDQMIRFKQDGNNMGVAPNFACGLNPVIPLNYTPEVEGPWSFIDKAEQPGPFGYYVAVYQTDGFGFLEVYDTLANPNGVMGFADFKERVHRKNDGRVFDRHATNTYVTIDGTSIQFKVDPDSEIVSLNGQPPYDPNRTNGTIINSDGQGLLTIDNPALGKRLTLDGRVPENPIRTFDAPLITVAGPVHFADTCVGTTSFTTLDVCNTGFGDQPAADLFVYSIISKSPAFAVTEPSSGYPVAIAPGSCFPFQAQFTPTGAELVMSTIRISNNDPGKPFLDVGISGTGIQQNISTFIASGGAFGDVCRDTFRDLDSTINNSGGCDLVIGGIGSSDPEFRTASVMSYPLVVRAGTSTHVPIRLAPTTLGTKSASIAIASNDPDTPSTVIAVAGNTPPGTLRLTGSTDFGDVCAGTLAEKRLDVCNVGICNLNVASVKFVGTCADFALVNNPFPAAVSPDSCEDVVIRFTPTSCGPKSCTLRVETDDPNAARTDMTVNANTPCPSIDVPPDQCFPPTVIQSVGACTSAQPFPILNKGTCPLAITAISFSGANGARYSLSGMPSLPLNLQPGHTVGDGALRTVFAPTLLSRDTVANIAVTYESDPITRATTTVTRTLNGEGVRTGARALVKYNSSPVSLVDKMMVQRITGNRNRKLLDTVDNAMNLPLTTVTPAGPCEPFQYHREYATVSNPIQLAPGSYQLTASATVGKKKYSKVVGFDVNTCTFNPNIVITLP